jgi:hypothetical protein
MTHAEPAAAAHPTETAPQDTHKPASAAVAEPQNALTEKFTDQEWKAVVELRVRIWAYVMNLKRGADA